MKKIKVGILGCGTISDIYLTNLKEMFGSLIELVGCADIIEGHSREKAEKYQIKQYTVDELINSKTVELVVNLTIPAVHYETCKKLLTAGKHIYVEKPISLSQKEGEELTRLADSKSLLIGAAPDTFLGAGLQTCCKAIDDGWIGRPLSATAFMTCRGHESWHPSPEFYYKQGGGPMFDMGPYYLTALVALIGQVSSVMAVAEKGFSTRTVTSEPMYGKVINVDVPTHVTGIMRFANGAVGTIVTSFDICQSSLPVIEIYGTEGTLRVPDPNTFGGPVELYTATSGKWHELPLVNSFSENSRGVGVADMAAAIVAKREQRASGKMAVHILDIMESFYNSSHEKREIEITSQCKRPKPLPLSVGRGNYRQALTEE